MMAPDLQRSLRASVQLPPAETLDLDALVTSGRQRVRRRALRRTAAGAGVGSLLAVVAAAAVVFPGVSGVRVGQPAGGAVPAGQVLHLDDAAKAVRGTDFRVLSSYDSSDLDDANDRSFGPMLPDGTVVVQDGPHGTDNRSRWGLLETTTGRTDWLPAPPGPERPSAPQRVVAADDRYVVLDPSEVSRGALVLWVLDRSDGRWHRSSVDVSGTPARDFTLTTYALGGDTLLVGFASTDPTRRELHSVSLSALARGGGELHDEEVSVGDFAVTDDRLVYLERTNAPTSQMHVRRLDDLGRDEKVVDVRSGDRCNQLSLQAAGGYVALGQYCGTALAVRDDRVQVVDLDGEPVVTVQDSDLDGAAAMTDRFVTMIGSAPGNRGTYAYDLQARRLVQLSDQPSSWYGGNAGSGDRLAWSQDILDGRGRRTFFAQLP